MKTHPKAKRIGLRAAACVLGLLFALSFGPGRAAADLPGREVYRVAVDPTRPPFLFQDENGVLQGFHIDLMNAIAEMRNADVVYTVYESSYACMDALRQGEADMALGCRLGAGDAGGLRSIGEISSSYLCLLAFKDMPMGSVEPPYKRLVFEYGSIDYSYLLLEQQYSSFCQGVSNQSMVYEALISGKADVIVGERESLTYLLERDGYAENYTILQDYLAHISHTIYVRSADRALYTELSNSMLQLRIDGVYETLHNLWIKDNELEAAKARLSTVRSTLILIACVSILSIGIVLLFNKTLKEKVNEKTKSLHEANEELARQMQTLESASTIRRRVIELSHWGIVFFDRGNRILLANEAALAIAGMQGKLAGNDIRSVPVFSELLERIQGAPESVPANAYTTVALGEGAEKREFRCGLFLSLAADDHENTLFTVEDITNENRKKQALFEQEKNSTLNRMVAGIAHEIRNPLMSIRTAAFLLKKQGADPKVQETIVKLVPDEVDRINRLVEGLIHYAKPIRGAAETLDAAQIARECVYIAGGSVRNGEVELKVELEEGLRIYVNRDRLKQAFINLILNGIESIQQKRKSGVSDRLGMRIAVFSKREGIVSCLVRDEGVGMTREDIARCTTPFYSTKKNGTGLGVIFVQEFVNESNGYLEIQSTPGVYTEFTMHFRRVPGEA